MEILLGCEVWSECQSCPLKDRCEETLVGREKAWHNVALALDYLKKGYKTEQISKILGKSKRQVRRYLSK